MIKRAFLGLSVVLLMAFTTVIPTLASDPDVLTVKAEGTIQSVDVTAGTFTVLTEDGTTVTMYAPTGFDISLLVVGEQVEAKGTAGPDGLIAASEIELQDGTEFEVEDEDDDAGELEDDDDLDEDEDDDLDEDDGEDQDEDEGEDDEDDDADDDDSGSDDESDDDEDDDDSSEDGDDSGDESDDD